MALYQRHRYLLCASCHLQDNVRPHRIACVGECMVELSEYPDGRFSRGFGGDTLNTAIYFARLGMQVDYVTALGDDAFSDEMMRAWQSEGVGTSLVLRMPGGLPGLYIIQTDATGERRFSYWRDSAPARQLLRLPGCERIAEALPSYDLVYLSGITLSLYDPALRERLYGVLDLVRSSGGRVAFDTNFRPRGWRDCAVAREVYRCMLRRSDIVLAGMDDLHALFGFDHVQAHEYLRVAGPSETVLKLTNFACHVRVAAADWLVAPEPVADIVDTTAAGDSFAAAYLAARLSGEPPEAAARAGHSLAARVIGHRGAIIPRSPADRAPNWVPR